MSGFLHFDTGSAAPDWGSIPVDRAAQSRSVASVASVAADAEARAGIAKLVKCPQPIWLSAHAWASLIADVQAFANDWLIEALGLGWSIPEMFGCPPDPRARRVDLSGLVPLLRGRPVDSISATSAIIRNRIGAPNTFHRHAPGCGQPFDRSAAVPMWVAYAQEAQA